MSQTNDFLASLPNGADVTLWTAPGPRGVGKFMVSAANSSYGVLVRIPGLMSATEYAHVPAGQTVTFELYETGISVVYAQGGYNSSGSVGTATYVSYGPVGIKRAN